MKGATAIAAAVLATTLSGIPPATFAEPGAGDDALADALTQAKVPLEYGLAASSREGTPVSAMYEIFEEDYPAELRLSVFAMTGHVAANAPTFAKVIIDGKTGEINGVVPIRGGEDLAVAKERSKAMAQAKRSLEAATVHAVSANSGYRAVSATPHLEDGRPLAKVVLVNGSEWKTIYETLD